MLLINEEMKEISDRNSLMVKIWKTFKLKKREFYSNKIEFELLTNVM
jgi:hypothetical protein